MKLRPSIDVLFKIFSNMAKQGKQLLAQNKFYNDLKCQKTMHKHDIFKM